MLRRRLQFAFILILSQLSLAQEDIHKMLTLPVDLVKGANAVVRLDESEVTIESSDKVRYRFRRVVTVLKKEGASAVSAVVFYDPDLKASKIEARIYNASGKEIKKVKGKDFKDVSAVSSINLYDESRVKYLDYTPTSYPYTIDFSYELTSADTAFIFGWKPIKEERVSIEKSTYTLRNPQGLEIFTKQRNFEGHQISKNEDEGNMTYTLSGQSYYKGEMLSPAAYNRTPVLQVRLREFSLKGVKGKANSWAELGKWVYDKMVVGRDQLPEATLRILSQKLKDVDDPIEKARRIYKYVQENTRYISVQLGIGGWQPIEASEVDNVKYGDCKGLTNYTMALLKSQGITANYAVVWAGSDKRNMTKDFPALQGNHAILHIPVKEGEDVWLECTDQKKPFGFLGDFTDDRDVLIVTPEGGKIVHTTVYADEQNRQVTEAAYEITSKGELIGQVDIKASGIQYENHYFVEDLSEKERDYHYKNYWSHINGLVLDELKFSNNKEIIEYHEAVKLRAPDYASLIGKEMIIGVNPFDKASFVPDRYRNRKNPIQIRRGYVDTTSYTVQLPKGFKLSSLPEPIHVHSDYGEYQSLITVNDNHTLTYQRKLFIKSGLFPKEVYNDYRSFRRKIAKADNQKLVLIQTIE